MNELNIQQKCLEKVDEGIAWRVKELYDKFAYDTPLADEEINNQLDFLRALRSVMGIPMRLEDSSNRAKVLIDYGYNEALKNVREEIAKEMKIE